MNTQPSRRPMWVAVQSALCCAAVTGSAFAQQAETAPAEPPATPKIESVVVAGTRLPASIRSMPQSVQLIDSADISKQLAVAPNMADILGNLVPGISRGTNTGVNTYTSVRGRKPVFLVDGAPITSTLNDTAREVGLIDPDAVERIEVIPGSSALYGNSAGAGFINYVTKAGARAPLEMRTDIGADVSTSPLSADGSSPSVRHSMSGTVGKLDYRVVAMVKKIGDYYDADGNVIPPQPGSGIQNSTVKSLMAKLGYSIGRHRFEASANSYSQVADIEWMLVNGNIAQGIAATAVKAVPRPGQVPEENKSTVANLVYSTPALFGTTSSFRAQAYYVDTKSWFQYALKRFPRYPEAPNGQSGNITKKTGARFDVNTPLRTVLPMDGSILWGVDVLRDDTEIPLVDGRAFGIPQVLTSVAGFVQLQLRPFENWKVSAGLRRESSELDVGDYTSLFTRARITGGTLDFTTTPKNAGVVYSVTKTVDLYGGFSQGFDIQQTSQNFRAWPVDINLTKVKPPANVIDSYEGGIRYHGAAVRASLGIYQLKSSNGISYVFNAATPLEPRATVAPDKVEGVELMADYTGIESWTLGMTYAKSRGHADMNGDGVYELPLQNRRIPPASLTAYADYEFAPGAFVRVQGLYSGNRNEFPNTVPGRFHEGKVNDFFTLDVSARMPLAKNIDLTLGVRNLLNRDYFTNYSEGFNSNDNYLKAPGRTVSARVAFTY